MTTATAAALLLLAASALDAFLVPSIKAQAHVTKIKTIPQAAQWQLQGDTDLQLVRKFGITIHLEHKTGFRFSDC